MQQRDQRKGHRWALALVVCGLLAYPVPGECSLYGTDSMPNSRLLRINPANASVTMVGTMPNWYANINIGDGSYGGNIPIAGLAYNQADGFLYGTDSVPNSRLLRINPANASSTVVGTMPNWYANYPNGDGGYGVNFPIASLAYVPQAKTYGIFIGSNDYKADGTIKVNGQTDAEKVYAKFNQLVTFSDVKLLNYSVADTSSTPIGAIKAALDAYTNVLQPGDSLIFFYSGHGGGSTTNPAVNESLYVTKTAISGEFVDDDLTAWFLDGSRKDKWAGVNKMFILDSCFSGGFWNGENQDLNSLPKVALLAATGELQYAQADQDHNGEGFFSMALEDGLLKVGNWAKADVNKNGLTAEELRLWLENYVLPVNAVGYVKQDWPDDLVPVEWQVVGAMSGDFEMVVPEPATLSLLAAGGLLALRRRR